MITQAQLAKGYQQAKDLMRVQITLEQAHARVLAGLPILTEETRNEHGYSVFRYFLPNSRDSTCADK
jgi:hypothetical protein